MRLTGGLRAEMFTFDVHEPLLIPVLTSRQDGQPPVIVLPKVNLILGPWFRTEFFANYGEGYHSNDARSAVAPGSSPLAALEAMKWGFAPSRGDRTASS